MSSVRLELDSVDMDVAEDVLSSATTAGALMAIGSDIVDNAIRTYESASKGRGTRPFLYEKLFYFRMKVDMAAPYLEVGNTDPTAVIVEFGGHAGGKTRVGGYAPLRNGVDAAVRKWRRHDV